MTFQEIILVLDKHTTAAYNLHNIMVKFRDTISKKKSDKHFGMKVHMTIFQTMNWMNLPKTLKCLPKSTSLYREVVSD